jgi:hypothetical protein
MSKERELLERALQLIDDAYEGQIALSLCNEIQELLAQPEQEPVAWMYDWNIIGDEEYGDTKYDALTRDESITNNRAITNIQPLYTAPTREPLGLEIMDVCGSEDYREGFKDGALYAEKCHGIGGKE